MKAIQAGTPIDGLADEPREDMEILVEDGTVTGVRVIETGDAPPDATSSTRVRSRTSTC
jgi:hypothetical protein